MKFALKPFKELVAMGQAGVDEALAPIRAGLAKMRAQQAIMELDEKILTQQKEIHELAVKKDINFDAICDKLDDIALMELRQDRLQQIVAQLFPEGQ